MQLSLSVLRPEDFLLLRLEFRDVDFTPPSAGQEGEVRGTPNGMLIVEFQPQHIAEQAFYEVTGGFTPTPAEVAARGQPGASDDQPLPPGTVQSRLAGPTRLVFEFPAAETIPFTLEGVLKALARLSTRVTAISSFDPQRTGCSPLDAVLLRFRVPPPPKISQPTDTETAIEAPYRLLMSPDAFAKWSHEVQPVTHRDWTELWHMRLGSHRPDQLTMRAVWSPDWQPSSLQAHFDPNLPTAIDAFRMSLDARDRNEIVHLTSNFHISGFVPSPVETEALALTALGALLEVEGGWVPPDLARGRKLTVEEWRHQMNLGRDQAVRVVYAGYLLPFGHRASLVKVTERKFVPQETRRGLGFVAYLRQRMFIIVREPERTYGHRSLPFKRVRVRTRVTPDLLDPTASQVSGHGQSAFWPRIPGPAGPIDFLFHLSAIDQADQAIEFTAPLIFVDRDVEANHFADLVGQYNAASTTRRERGLRGQPVAYARPAKPRDTTFDTDTVTFTAEQQSSNQPHFRPTMAQAKVDIPAVKQITGRSAPSEITFEPSYLNASGDAIGNAGQVFVRVVSSSRLDFGSTERSGGLVAPNLDISGLSRVLGPVGQVDQIVNGVFNPKQIFSGIRLLGAISLGDIVKDLLFNEALNTANKVPQLVTVREGDTLKSTYRWTLAQNELVDIKLFTPKAGSTLTLEATATKKLDASPPVMQVDGSLTNFSTTLLPAKDAELVEVNFKEIKFRGRPGEKVDVAVQMGEVEFKGILDFVNELRNWIPLDGFNDPPNLRLVQAPEPGVDVGYSMGIPTIGIGIMTMQNVSLSASAYLPFGKAPMNFRFAFCERQQPFTLTVSLFGGGGFFALNVGLDKVVMVEAALEFGASVALNLGVAQGQASIMAGFYFQKAGADFSLTGYFRASGSLSVLGIISVSLVFYLGLSYATKGLPHGGTLWGQASLTVKIEILFFSTSVSVKMEREFAGSDPRFHQLMSPSAWSEYCEAFADYA